MSATKIAIQKYMVLALQKAEIEKSMADLAPEIMQALEDFEGQEIRVGDRKLVRSPGRKTIDKELAREKYPELYEEAVESKFSPVRFRSAAAVRSSNPEEVISRCTVRGEPFLTIRKSNKH